MVTTIDVQPRRSSASRSFEWGLDWQSNREGCLFFNRVLNAAVERACASIDESFRERGPNTWACEDAFKLVVEVMSTPEGRAVGAREDYPMDQLAQLLTDHLQKKHDLPDAKVFRWGEVALNDFGLRRSR